MEAVTRRRQMVSDPSAQRPENTIYNRLQCGVSILALTSMMYRVVPLSPTIPLSLEARTLLGTMKALALMGQGPLAVVGRLLRLFRSSST